MKHTLKIMGIIAIVSIIVFSFVACDLDISKTTSDGFVYSGSATLTITGYTGKAKNISIPASINKKPVAVIGEFAFFQKQLTGVDIPGSVTAIEGRAFLDNQLASVNIPKSVTSIGDYAFYKNRLTSINIPDSVISVGVGAFGDNQLNSVTIPNSVTEIGHNAFGYNPLTNFSIASDNPAFIIKDFLLMSKDEKQLIGYYGSEKSINIPDSVISVGVRTFADKQLTSIIIPDSVTAIGSSAFYSNNLTNVTIPDSVTTFGSTAFYGNNLTSITIGANVTLENTFHHSTGPGGWAFDSVFHNTYNSGGRLAGTYTRSDNVWTRQ